MRLLFAEPHGRNKRSLKSKNKKSNTSVIFSRDDIKREVQLAMSSLACKVNCAKGIRRRRGKTGPRGKQGPPGPQGPQGRKGNRGAQGDHQGLKAIRALKDQRAILVNPSQLHL